MKATKNIDIYAINKKPVKVIDVVQYDTGIQIVFNVKDFTIPSDSTATLYVQKPSGKFVYQEENITVADNTITVNLENQALTEHGKVPYQVTISSESDTITTFTGLILVEKSLKDAGAIESKTVQKAFDKLTAEMLEEFQTNAETVVNAEIATIPEDYTELFTKVNESANAIKGKLSGAVVVADDVSPVEHLMNVNVHGKNLFVNKTERSGSANGLTFVMPANTSNVVFNGTAKTENSIAFPNTIVLKKGTYTASIVGANTPSTGSDRVYLRDVTTNAVIINHITSTSPRTFTLTETTKILANFVFKEGSFYDNTTISIQIEEGNTATEYEPYIDQSTVKVTRCGKNILPYPFYNKTKSENGITFTDNEDGTLTVNGTATDNAFFHFVINESIKVKGKYVLSGMSGGSGSTYYIQPFISGKAVSGLTEGYKSYELDGILEKITMVVSKGSTLNNLKVNLQLEQGEFATNFEPYNGTEYIPTSDGEVPGVDSISPNMTIMTDTEGVIVECEYNKDTNKVIKKITDALGITI